jgi:hypothetical protein
MVEGRTTAVSTLASVVSNELQSLACEIPWYRCVRSVTSAEIGFLFGSKKLMLSIEDRSSIGESKDYQLSVNHIGSQLADRMFDERNGLVSPSDTRTIPEADTATRAGYH